MGWILLLLLHLFCATAGVVGVHSQCNATESSVVHDQAFEGEAVHSMMRSWLEAGTSPDLFNKTLGGYFTGHPCHGNMLQSQFRIICSEVKYKWEDSNWVRLNTLTEICLEDDSGLFLIGTLHPAILNLTNLQSLSIYNANKLFGPLPSGLFYSLSALRSIVLYNCSFNGSIGDGFNPRITYNIGLQSLDLSYNSFTKMSAFQTHDDNFLQFINLQHLNVSHNQIQGEFAISTRILEFVDISNNFITNIDASMLGYSIKSIFAQNNYIRRFPTELFEYETLQDIYLDSNNISSIEQNFSNVIVSPIQRISMSMNKFQLFPKGLLQLSTLEEINLDFNHITGELHMPNISCQYSKIKSISLLYNQITHFYPSNDTTSCFSESRILWDNKVFLGGNPICTNRSLQARVLPLLCRFNASSPIEVFEELTTVKGENKILLIIIACVSSAVVILFIIGFFVIQKLKKKISLLREIQSEFDKRDVKPNLYSLRELKVATQDFHSKNELGRGGFGIVYKGIFPDGSLVAIKKLTKSSIEQGIQDFLGEIIVVSNIKHRNLVQLKGCCISQNHRILVHEFVENKNLKDALWGHSKSNGHLDWPTRFNIILGIARGLAYLHEDVQPAIVHRDIKGENILLDKDYNPKIADFGLALFFPTFDDGETHMSVSKVAGTKGYMAPEYFCYGQVSTKLDVFSFGVLLLEIVSGRRMIDLKSPSTEENLVQWAEELHSIDSLANLKDKSFQEMKMVEEATFKQVVKVGLLCLHHIATRRPAMSEVVAMLIGKKNLGDCTLEECDEGASSIHVIGSSNLCFPTPNVSLQCIGEDDSSLHLDIETCKQSLEVCKIELLNK